MQTQPRAVPHRRHACAAWPRFPSSRDGASLGPGMPATHSCAFAAFVAASLPCLRVAAHGGGWCLMQLPHLHHSHLGHTGSTAPMGGGLSLPSKFTWCDIRLRSIVLSNCVECPSAHHSTAKSLLEGSGHAPLKGGGQTSQCTKNGVTMTTTGTGANLSKLLNSAPAGHAI